MKKTLQFFAFLVLSIFSSKAQTFTCNSFCITNIQMDSVIPNGLNVTLFVGATANDFINYPYFSALLNSNGDTVATGFMNFFGQFGNSSQDYPMTTSLTSIPSNFSGTAYFHYDTNSCVLTFPCEPTQITETADTKFFTVFPNPSSGTFTIKSNFLDKYPQQILLYNSLGKLIFSDNNVNKNQYILETSSFPKGIYFLELRHEQKKWVEKLIIR